MKRGEFGEWSSHVSSHDDALDRGASDSRTQALSESALGYADYYRSAYPFEQEHRCFGGLRLFRAPRHPAGQYVEQTDGVSLQISRTPRLGVSQIDLGAGRFTAALSAPNYIVAPPGHACTYDLTSDIDLLVIEFSSDVFSAHPWRLRDAGPLHHGARYDAFLIQFAEQIWKLSKYGTLQLEADSLGMSLATLLARSAQLPSLQKREKGGLTPREFKLVTEYMTAKLGDDVSLSELSNLVSRSPFHFSRAFKISAGVPPHRYLTLLRVHRAKELLRLRTMTVAQVAYACGFASSQHFATVFRRAVGITATQFKRELSAEV